MVNVVVMGEEEGEARWADAQVHILRCAPLAFGRRSLAVPE